MTSEAARWQQIQSIYYAALDRDPGERSAFLVQVCAGDEQLRSEVDSLISSHKEAGSFLESPAMGVAAKAIAEEQAKSLAGGAVGPYRVVSLLGRGGMGEVYLAEDDRLGRKLALKLLPLYFTGDKDRLRRFQQEARAASALNHPNIITIFDIGQLDSIHFIATEYIQGETLRQRISREKISTTEALEITMQIASALAAAHDAGIVHRDIKPENVMLRPDGIVKVLDFGLAKLTEQRGVATGLPASEMSTVSGIVMGTASYMSPEQARGAGVDARTDIFSLGVVLYEMITGRLPFGGSTASHVIVAILEKEPPPLSAYAEGVPEALEWIVAKALTKDREGRYQTAREFLADVARLRKRLDYEMERERLQSGEAAGTEVRTAHATGGLRVTVDTGDKLVARTDEQLTERTTSGAQVITGAIKRQKKNLALTLAALLVVAAIAFVVYKLATRNQPVSKTAGPFDKVKITKLTTTGRASIAAVSPDGKYIAHAMGGANQQSLWLRHIATGSDTEIVPTAKADYNALAFSPDGNYIFFMRWESVEGRLYRVPVLGGPIKKLYTDIDANVTISPDLQRIAYMRGYPPGNETHLIVANADGAGEEIIARYPQRDSFVTGGASWGPAWSPDGEMIAFALKHEEAGRKYWNVTTIRVKDRTEHQLTFQKWMLLGQMAWLADGSGLVVAAADEESTPAQQLWLVSYPTGDVRRITNDPNNYDGISLTADSTAIATVQTEQTSNLWATPDADASRAAQITSSNYDGASGLCLMPDGKILFTRTMRGRTDIFLMNADGTGQKQLTADAGRNIYPAITPDGRHVVFSSNRTGRYCIWRMDIDGGNLKQLTDGGNDQRPIVTADGRWVFYNDNKSGASRVWKVPIDGGDPVQITDYTSNIRTISPDGKYLGVGFTDEQASPKRWRFGIVPLEGGPPIKVFDIYEPVVLSVCWTSDGRALTYVETLDGVSNIWIQPLDGSPAKQLTNFKADLISHHAWSRDGKQLVCARGSNKSDVVLVSDLK